MNRTDQVEIDGKPRDRRYVPGRAQARTRPDSTTPAVAPVIFYLDCPQGANPTQAYDSGLQAVQPAEVSGTNLASGPAWQALADASGFDRHAGTAGRTPPTPAWQGGETVNEPQSIPLSVPVGNGLRAVPLGLAAPERGAARSPRVRGTPRSAFPTGAQRRGFTLTELLVVMLIIGILSALAISALLGALGTSRAAATRALIEKLDRGLMDRLASLESRKIDVLPIDSALADDGGIDGDNSDEPLRALVIAKKRLTKEEFPQWFEVVKNGGVVVDLVGDWDPLWVDWNQNGAVDPANNEVQLPATVSPVAQAYRRTVLERGSTPGSFPPDGALLANHDPRTTSAECLYLILTQGPGGSAVKPAEFGSREVADTDGDGLPELIDGYGLPLRFFRWPTHYRSSLQKGDGPYAVGERREEDRTDQNRLLVLTPWWTNVRRPLFENAQSVSPLNGAIGPFAFHDLSESPTADGRDNDRNGTIDDAGELAVAWAWEASLSGLNPNYGSTAAPPLVAREYYTQPLIVSSGPDEHFGMDVRAPVYLQARILADWTDVFPTTASYQATVQTDPFAVSVGGSEEEIGAHLDNFTNHDLRSNQ